MFGLSAFSAVPFATLGNSFVNITNATATGSVGTISNTSLSSLTLSAVTSTGAVGNITTANSQSLSSVTGTGSVGTVSLQRSEPDTGTSATGSVGNITTANSQSLSGVTGTGAVGSVAIIDIGTTATGSVGAISITVTPPLSSVTSTSSVGSLTVSTAKAATGTTATGSVGSISSALNIALSGTAANGAIGAVLFSKELALTGVVTERQAPYYGWNTFGNTAFAALTPNGTQPSGCSVGTVIAVPATYITLDGVTGNGSAGNTTVDRVLEALTGVVTERQAPYYGWNTFGNTAFAALTPNGTQPSECSVGAVFVATDIALSKVTSTGSAGAITSADKLFSLLGVKGYGKVGKIIIKPHWENINDAGAANWMPIDTLSSVDVWSTISNNSSTTWASINTDSGNTWSTIDDAQPVDWQLVITEDV